MIRASARIALKRGCARSSSGRGVNACDGPVGSRRPRPPPTLIALEVHPRTEPAEPVAAPITIRLASGLGVEVHAGFDVVTLQAVVKALEAVDVRA